MIAHALEDDPNECCGVLAGKDPQVSRLYRVTNTAHSPYRYLMDSQGQLNAMLDSESRGLELLAFYHSHTHSQAYPSTTDVRMALQSGWLDICYVLVSLKNREDPQIRAFRISEAGTCRNSRSRSTEHPRLCSLNRRRGNPAIHALLSPSPSESGLYGDGMRKPKRDR